MKLEKMITVNIIGVLLTRIVIVTTIESNTIAMNETILEIHLDAIEAEAKTKNRAKANNLNSIQKLKKN